MIARSLCIMTDVALFDDFLLRSGLRTEGEIARYRPLAGGVSSDIYRVDLPGRSLCIKRALPKLKVSAEWHAPVSRSDYEWRWLSFVKGCLPDAVPTPLAQDPASGLFAMSFLDPGLHPVWKAQLLRGEVVADTAAAVGFIVGRIHSASTRDIGVLGQFDSDANFHALRLDPYLVATAAKHPEVARQLHQLVDRTASTKHALVHGDISPKNILVGPQGPVILDAECAWFGDPAFDLAFCLNHLLLKCLPQPGNGAALRTSFDRLSVAYLNQVTWEPYADLEARAAALLPALLLARVDGKAPVEYVTREDDRNAVRDFACALIRTRATRLSDVADRWYPRFLREGAPISGHDGHN